MKSPQEESNEVESAYFDESRLSIVVDVVGELITLTIVGTLLSEYFYDELVGVFEVHPELSGRSEDCGLEFFVGSRLSRTTR